LCHDEIKQSDRIRMGIIGVPGKMRTVRSLLTFLSRFANAIEELVIITDDVDPFSKDNMKNSPPPDLTSKSLATSMRNCRLSMSSISTPSPGSAMIMRSWASATSSTSIHP